MIGLTRVLPAVPETAQLGPVLMRDPELRLYCATRPAHVVRRPETHDAAEHIVRPVVAVFRVLLDRYGLVLDGGCVGYELDRDGVATGRIVLGPVTPVAAGRAGQLQVYRAVRRLAAELDKIADGVDAVVHQELRYLRPETAAVLDTEHRWRRHVHAVSVGQQWLLTDMIRRIAAAALPRRVDPSLPKPVVLVKGLIGRSVPGLDRFAWDVRDAGGDLVFAGTGCADVGDGVEVVATVGPLPSFETLPRPTAPFGVPLVPSLSHARSLEEVQIGELRAPVAAAAHAVRLDREETAAVVRRLVAHADAAADRTACRAMRLGGGVAEVVHHVLTRKQFLKGSRSTYPRDRALSAISRFVDRGAPIEFVLVGFPVKQCESGLKAVGALPDLAELGSMVRLAELHRTIRRVYEPGARITVLTDGRRYRPRPAALLDRYRAKLTEYAQLAGCGDVVRLMDIDEQAERVFGPGTAASRAGRVAEHERTIRAALRGVDVTSDPLAAVRAADRLVRTAPGEPLFGELFTSIMYSVPVSEQANPAAVYADLYAVRDASQPAQVTDARTAVLSDAWRWTIRYLATLHADTELDYSRLWASAIRLKVSRSAAGTYGFCFLGGSGLLPWHGTGAVDRRAEVSADFAVVLADRGFVPVFSPLLGDAQPWFLAPVTSTSDGELDPDLLQRIRLRRK